MLKGKRTYFVAILMILLNGVLAMGWITQEQFLAIQGVLAGFGLAALRAGVANAAPKG